MDAVDFLEKPRLHPVMVLHGDEDYLRRRTEEAIRRLALGEAGDEFGLAVYSGDKASLAEVLDDWQTVPLFGERRLVVVEQADSFVSLHRARLEKVFTKDMSATNILVLQVKTWTSTTNLAKLLPDRATLACKALTARRLPQWCVKHAATHHQKKLAPAAAALLVDLVGGELGLLDQELIKLASYVGARQTIEVADVARLVGRSRSENTWKIFDSIGEGNAAGALVLLDRLFDQGEEPVRLAAAFSMQLRRLVKAYRLNSLGKPLALALQEAGFPPFAIAQGERQLKHLGRRRLDKIYDWLIETDLGIKGGSQLPPRTLLERLVLRLAR